ncbi:MAG: hypothetical protein H8D62_02415, partial [Bacteroidetes bacterium]|nr:hypothetical protein [Bacteroidota bacterium]
MKYLILLASLLFACQPSSPTIVGKWLNKTDKEWHFKHNGDFVWTQGEDTLLSDLKYSLSTNTITLKKKNAEFLTFHYVFLGNSSLILWNYKTHEFNSHIDEIGLFHQVGKKYDFSKHN